MQNLKTLLLLIVSWSSLQSQGQNSPYRWHNEYDRGKSFKLATETMAPSNVTTTSATLSMIMFVDGAPRSDTYFNAIIQWAEVGQPYATFRYAPASKNTYISVAARHYKKYEYNVTQLKPNTKYKVKCFLFYGSSGNYRITAGGNEVVFSTSGSTTITNNVINDGNATKSICSSNSSNSYEITGSTPIIVPSLSPSYHWEKESSPDNWDPITGQISSNFKGTSSATSSSFKLRRVVTSGVTPNQTTSNSAPINVNFETNRPAITQYAGKSGIIALECLGCANDASIQWQRSNSFSGPFTDWVGQTGLILSLESSTALDSVYTIKRNLGAGNQCNLILDTIGVTPADGSGFHYLYTKIGTKYWTVNNLRAQHYYNTVSTPESIAIPTIGLASTEWPTPTVPGLNTPFANATLADSILYGLVYNGKSVIDTISSTNKLCPVGWHVGTYTDYSDLSSSTSGMYASGKFSTVIRTTNDWMIDQTKDPNTDITNFNLTPSGQVIKLNNAVQRFAAKQRAVLFRDGTGSTGDHDYQYWLFYYNNEKPFLVTGTTYSTKHLGSSIRCVKN